MAGGGDTPELVAAVSESGALGCFGAAYSSPQEIAETAAKIRRLTKRPFAVNLFSPVSSQENLAESQLRRATDALSGFYKEFELLSPNVGPSPHSFAAQVEACLGTDAAALSFTFGTLPEDVIAAFKAKGMLLAGTATTVEEALVLKESGVDAVIAQGTEAGGHRGTFIGDFERGMIGLLAFIPQVRDATSLPVIAAGGIMDGRGIAAALCLGAEAVQMGTAFLLCDEAGVPECYKAAVQHSHEDQLVLTTAFSGRLARGIGNLLTEAMQVAERSDAVLPFPFQNQLTRPIRVAAARRGDAGYLSLWAGQGVRMARRMKAADLVTALLQETSDAVAQVERSGAVSSNLGHSAPRPNVASLPPTPELAGVSKLLCERPKVDEYPPYVFMYLRHVADGVSLLEQLEANAKSTCDLLSKLGPDALTYRYEPGKWTIKDILCHITDDERIYSYRALRFSRSDDTVLPGFDQDKFAVSAAAEARSMTDLLDEFTSVRGATIALFRNLSDGALLRRGIADGRETTVRALAYHIAGHEVHHVDLIRRLYLSR